MTSLPPPDLRTSPPGSSGLLTGLLLGSWSSAEQTPTWPARWTTSPAPRTDRCPGSRTWPERATAETGTGGQSAARARGRAGTRVLTVLLLRLCRPSLSVSSLTPMALGRSCLLANTRITASFSSSSWTCGRQGHRGSRDWSTCGLGVSSPSSTAPRPTLPRALCRYCPPRRSAPGRRSRGQRSGVGGLAAGLPYLRVLVVVSPQWPDLVLAANIPDGEADVLVLHRLHVKA